MLSMYISFLLPSFGAVCFAACVAPAMPAFSAMSIMMIHG
jgi:hypothetical protein